MNKVVLDDSEIKEIIGKKIHAIIDRKINTKHPRNPNIIYELNYGYVPGIIAGDGAEQDVYVIDETNPIDSFDGVVIAIIVRNDDVETKWICAKSMIDISDEEIMNKVHFVEQYFDSYIVR